MLASTRPSVRLRRAACRGSVVGLGLLVATSAIAPAALADPGPTEGTETAPETGQDGEEAPGPLNPVPAADGAEGEDSPEAEAPTAGGTVDEPGVAAETPVDEAGDVVVGMADPPLLAPAYADFGSGKDFGLQVQPSDLIPEDLDLSGATFAVTRVGEETPAGICTTDGYGSCAIGWDGNPFAGWFSDLVLSAGDYEIRQTSASTGLAGPADTLGVIHVCSCATDDRAVPVPNASLFRTRVITTVVDADSERPLRGASYGLTGPDYPHLDWRGQEGDPEVPFPGFPFPGFPGLPVGDATVPAAVPAAVPATVDDGMFDAGIATTGADGTATHEGWFLPGEGYALTPVTAPAGYAPDTAHEFTLASPSADSGTPWTITRRLTSSDSGLGSGGSPPPAPRPRPVPAPAPAPAPAPVVAPDAAPADLGPDRAPAAPAAAEEAAPSPTAAPRSTPATAPQPPPTDRGGDSPVFSAGETPELETVASDLPDAGWVAAFGGMFLAVVLFAFALVRRRARRHG